MKYCSVSERAPRPVVGPGGPHDCGSQDGHQSHTEDEHRLAEDPSRLDVAGSRRSCHDADCGERQQARTSLDN